MLSYKHGYHAGNHADVMKHIIMLYLYNLEKKVNNSISYVDTHSGNGIYKYISKYMDKNKEYKEGIKKIQNYKGNNILIRNYLSTISKITGKNNFYPGSPIFISSIANEKDKLFASGEESARLTIIHLGLSLGLTTLLNGLCVKKGQKLCL